MIRDSGDLGGLLCGGKSPSNKDFIETPSCLGLPGGQEVAGSNPVSPTIRSLEIDLAGGEIFEAYRHASIRAGSPPVKGYSS